MFDKRGSVNARFAGLFSLRKKGDIGWDSIGKIILMLIFLFVLIGIIMLLSGKSFSLIERIKQLLRF